ncbi:MAG: YbaB/EbfC family nucleoid-associated protein, partial [Phycisphaerae bacterium]|nr:YbaB/EbfC family nucleoid-associated protein [Phycisphaerae bacterium]
GAADQADQHMVEELIAAAVNAATGKARQLIGDELRRATGGLDIPGLNDLLGGSRSDRSPES